MTFKQEGPSVATNSLPGHEGPATNAIDDLVGQSLIRSVGRIQTPLEVIHAKFCYFWVIEEGCDRKGMCVDPHCVGACEAFKLVLQDLFDRHIVQVGVQEKEENVLTLQSDGGQNRDSQKPIEVTYSQSSRSAVVKPKSIVIQIPRSFSFQEE